MKSRYLVTGATGYVGSMFVKDLLNKEADITVLVRNEEKAKAMLGESIKMLLGDITDKSFMDSIDGEYDYIFHFAATTKSATMVSCPVETADGIVEGTKYILELAKRCNVKSMVYVSSMEAYGDIDCSDGHRAKEDELGNIDLFSPRSCYPMGKRMAEHLCFLYWNEYGVPVKIARLAQTFGKGLLPGENRVFAQFAKSVIDKKDIVLKTRGLSMGNYCEITDVIRGLHILLEKGSNGEAYNLVNENSTMRICDMAEMVANEIAHGEIKVIYDIDESNASGYAADTGLRLSGEKMRKLGFEANVSLKETYLEMIEELKGKD